MMDRRGFVKFIALTAAGIAAIPDQLLAFEQYYDANTPQTNEALVAVDEICLYGMAPRSTRILTTFFPDASEVRFGFNAFGGVLRWVAAADQKIILRRRHVSWSITSIDPLSTNLLSDTLGGHISYVGQDKVRQHLELCDWTGSL